MSSRQRQTNHLEMVISNYIRNNYESKYDKQHIPTALKHLMVKFSQQIISSSILSSQKDLELVQSLKTKSSNIKKFNLLYRASEHKFAIDKFHALCDNKGPTLTIIESEFGNIFGGYTSKSWSSELGYVQDEDAFLFLVSSDEEKFDKLCPLLFDIKKGSEPFAIFNIKNRGPIFGQGFDIFIMDKERNSTMRRDYEYGAFERRLCGGGHKQFAQFQTIEYEVFLVQ